MTRSAKQAASRSRRCRDDSGAALVEFALVSILLCVLLFGIINFGFILSFKQDMTRAAAEGARAGAVAVAGQSAADARAATEEAVKEFGNKFQDDCDTEGLTCTPPSVHNCGQITAGPDDGIPDCITVELIYDYDSHPLLPEVPLLSAFLPNEIKATSVVRINEQ